MKNKIIPYNPKLKEYARQLRNNSTLAEILVWQKIKNRALGIQFHRQVPLLDFIVDFFCHELQLAIEIEGESHEYLYNDPKRQGLLEKKGVEFIRFSDQEVLHDTFSVHLALEEKVRELLEVLVPGNTPRPKLEPMEKIAPTPPKIEQVGNHFGKKEKLKSRKLIEQLFEEGKSISIFPIKLIYLQVELPEKVKIQAGVTVPKKKFKSAVKRNRIKRLLREAYRLNKQLVFNNSKGDFALLFLYLGKEMPQYLVVEKSMKKVLEKFIETIGHEKND